MIFYNDMLENGKVLNKALKKTIDWDKIKENLCNSTSPPKWKRYKNIVVNRNELIHFININE